MKAVFVASTMDLTTHRLEIPSVAHHSSGNNFAASDSDYVSPSSTINNPGPRAAKSVFSIRSIVEENKSQVSTFEGKKPIIVSF